MSITLGWPCSFGFFHQMLQKKLKDLFANPVITFSDNYRYCSLILHPNSTNGSFLKVVILKHITGLFILCAIKPIGFSFTLDGFKPMHNVVTSYISHLENISSMKANYIIYL